MMDTIRRHAVPLKGVVSTVVISTVVLEGWSTKLDPDIRIMEVSSPLHALTMQSACAHHELTRRSP